MQQIFVSSPMLTDWFSTEDSTEISPGHVEVVEVTEFMIWKTIAFYNFQH